MAYAPGAVERAMKVQEVILRALSLADGRWNAEARVRRVRSNEKPYIATAKCRKPTSEAAETAALVVAEKWVDRRESASA
jgi:hypothetical protein